MTKIDFLGYKQNTPITIEGGHFNQNLQQGRRTNNQTIMQRNNGLVLSSILNLQLTYTT